MTRDDVLAALRDHEQELRAAGVVSLSVFGSVARGESRDDSDVDVVVRLGDDFSAPGLDYFGRLDDLERRLSEILGRDVDVIEEPVRKARVQHAIDRDRAFAF
jgi:uncharacterized protein